MWHRHPHVWNSKAPCFVPQAESIIPRVMALAAKFARGLGNAVTRAAAVASHVVANAPTPADQARKVKVKSPSPCRLARPRAALDPGEPRPQLPHPHLECDPAAVSSNDGDSDIVVGRLTADEFRLLCQAKAAVVLPEFSKPDAESFRSVADSVLDLMCNAVASGPQHADVEEFILDLLSAAGGLLQSCNQRRIARAILQGVCNDWLADDWGNPEPHEPGEGSEKPHVQARHIDADSFKNMFYDTCMDTFYLHSEEHVQHFKGCALALAAQTRQVLSEIKEGEDQDIALVTVVEACEHLLPSAAALAVFQDVAMYILLVNGHGFGFVAGREPHPCAFFGDGCSEGGSEDSPERGCVSDDDP